MGDTPSPREQALAAELFLLKHATPQGNTQQLDQDLQRLATTFGLEPNDGVLILRAGAVLVERNLKSLEPLANEFLKIYRAREARAQTKENSTVKD